MGDEEPDMQPGDISFVIVESPHEVFRRDGDDLHTRLKITLLESLIGFRKTITHLDGREIEIDSKNELKITIPDQIIVIQNEGMPLPEYGSEKGDLFVKIHVDFPKSLTLEQQKQIEMILTQ